MNKQTLVYVNYAPYENSGHVFDFLKERFARVIVFIFNFHSLGRLSKSSTLSIYEHGKLISRRPLLTFTPHLPVYLVFLLLPLRSILNGLQIFYYTYRVKKRFGEIHYYFTVNAFTAWIGNILRKTGFVDRTVFWVWDYYPPKHADKIVMLMRSIYWQFDRAALSSNRVVFLNERLMKLRQKIAIPQGLSYPTVPIGTLPIRTIPQREIARPTLSFVGVVKQSQGLDMLFDSSDLLTGVYPHLEVHIIGSGPDEGYFQKRARHTPLNVTFHGYLDDERQIARILRKQHIGLALYKPDPSNVSYFGDPSKIKDYLSFGIPVITTNVFEFSKEIARTGAGMIVKYGDKNDFVKAVQTILNDYRSFSKNAHGLSRKYHYQKIYPALFSSLP